MDALSSPERCEPGRADVDRWRTSAVVLEEVRRAPGLTRVELVARRGLSSATTTETVARLRELGWLTESRAPVTGRGRPTTCLVPAPGGPVVLALDLRHEHWRLATAGLDGAPTVVAGGPRDDDLTARLAAAFRDLASVDGSRPRALGVSAPAPLSDASFVRTTELDWGSVGLDGLVAPFGTPPVPVLPGNDATLAGLAEVRRGGAAADASTVLSLTVEVGLGGALLLDGRPQAGAHGAAGEYGHLPFGDPDRSCPCGAHGCWGREVDGFALAASLGEPPPADPRSYADAVCDAAEQGDAASAAAVARSARALGRGVAGLVNAHDPDVVVLGGLAPRMRGTAFDEAFDRGLMAFRQASPAPVRDAAFGADAPLRGAVALALDHATSPDALARAAG